MCEDDASVGALRSQMKQLKIEIRTQSKETLLKSKRFANADVCAPQDVTVEKFQETLLKLKKKKLVTIELLQFIRECLMYEHLRKQLFKTDGILQALLSLLTGNSALLQWEVVTCLVNLCCNHSKLNEKISRMFGPYLVLFLNTNAYLMQDQCCMVLGNLCANGSRCGTLLSKMGLLHPLFKLITSPSHSVVKAASFTLMNYFRYQWNQSITEAQFNVLKQIVKSQSMIEELYWSLFYLSCNPANVCLWDLAYLEAVLLVLFKAVSNDEYNVVLVTPLLRIIGNSFTLSSMAPIVKVHASVLEKILTLLFLSPYAHLRKEARWVAMKATVLNKCFIIEEVSS